MKILSTKVLSDTQRQLLTKEGMHVVEYDAIQITPKEIAFSVPIENAIITSKNAAKIVVEANLKIDHLFCVGNKTSKYLEDNGYRVVEVASKASELAHQIITNHSGKSFLFFCGNKRREELPRILKEHKVQFKEEVVYTTTLNLQKIEGDFDAVLFFSPSAVQSFAFENTFEDVKVFCIGKTTAAEAMQFTNSIYSPEIPSVQNTINELLKIVGLSS